MIDIKLLRDNPDKVRLSIARKKFKVEARKQEPESSHVALVIKMSKPS